jgi:hypothetical protein
MSCGILGADESSDAFDRVVDEMAKPKLEKRVVAADGFKEAFGKEWGCNLISIIFLVFVI